MSHGRPTLLSDLTFKISVPGGPIQSDFGLSGAVQCKHFILSIIVNPCHQCHFIFESGQPLYASKCQFDPATRKTSPPKSLLRPLQLCQRSRARSVAPDGGARCAANFVTRTTAPRPSAGTRQRPRPPLERRRDEARRPQTRNLRTIIKTKIVKTTKTNG
jgi:hypothetical protein